MGLHSHVHESISFKLGMVKDTIKFHILIQVTLTFTQDHRGVRKFELLQSFS